MTSYPYVWRWDSTYKWNRDGKFILTRHLSRKGELCRVVCRGTMNSALIEFQDGHRTVTTRNGIRKATEADAMNAHVMSLAEEHDIEVYWVPTAEAAVARAKISQIGIPDVTNVDTYYLALHEIGHVVGRGRSKPILEREANAWAYAIETAKWPPTEEVREMIKTYLGSYGGYIRVKKDGTIALGGHRRRPDDGHPYWSLLEDGTL